MLKDESVLTQLYDIHCPSNVQACQSGDTLGHNHESKNLFSNSRRITSGARAVRKTIDNGPQG